MANNNGGLSDSEIALKNELLESVAVDFPPKPEVKTPKQIINEYAIEYAKEAIERTVEIMRTAEEPKDVLAACKEILDRAVGKPRQQTEISGEDGAIVAINVLIQEKVKHALVGSQNRALPETDASAVHPGAGVAIRRS